MSTLKSDAVTAISANTDLSLTGSGTGGVKVADYLVQTKGSDISSATSLTLGKDGNLFDVTGTTTITSIATQGIGSYVTLHFDGILTFTHHSTDLILPGAANITTAVGDIAVMYEYASADWRCVSYTKASGAAVVGGGLTIESEVATTSGGTITLLSGISADAKRVSLIFNASSQTAGSSDDFFIQIGDSGGFHTSGYQGASGKSQGTNNTTVSISDSGFAIQDAIGAATQVTGIVTIVLQDASNFDYVASYALGSTGNSITLQGGGAVSLDTVLTQIQIDLSASATFDAGAVSAIIET